MKSCIAGSLVLAAGLLCAPRLPAAPADLLLSDFESADYGLWVAEGRAFESGPQDPRRLYPNRQGGRLAMSRLESGGDRATGTLTSPEFTLERRYLSFLLGGGDHAGTTCVALLLDGEVVASQPGFSLRTLTRVFWDVGLYQGRRAHLRLVDTEAGGWGHIAADDFVLTDTRPPGQELTALADLSAWQHAGGARVLADFDSGFAPWKVKGRAFGSGPRVAEAGVGAEGRGYASSRSTKPGAEDRQGSLVSPELVIDQPYLNFRIGGGDHPFRTAISLWVDGRVVRTTTGGNRSSLRWESWDVRDLKGRRATLGIYDMSVEDDLDFVRVDSIRLDNEAMGPVGGDVAAAARQARREAIATIRESARLAGADPDRPIYHYLPPAQLMNDPNGPAWQDGWHHVFFQYAVFSARRTADVHWGHARSRDLVSWETLPLAISPAWEAGEQSVYSGNMARDRHGDPVQLTTMVPYRENTGRRVWTARPADPAWTVWKRVPDDPPAGLVPDEAPRRNVKDPFPFSAGGRRFLVLSDQTDRSVVLYEALDDLLEKWTRRGDIVPKGRVEDECPNFLEVDGADGRPRWVFLSSPHDQPRYMVGAFDAASGRFTPQTEGRLNHAPDHLAPDARADARPDPSTGFYATTAYRDGQGRTILLGISKRLRGPGWTGGAGHAACAEHRAGQPSAHEPPAGAAEPAGRARLRPHTVEVSEQRTRG